MFVGKLEGRVSAEELRRGLGIRPEDLAEDLDATDAEAPEAREKPPLWGQGAVEEAVGGVCEAAEVGMTSAMTALRPRQAKIELARMDALRQKGLRRELFEEKKSSFSV